MLAPPQIRIWSPTSCLGPSDTRIGTDRYALGDLWIMQRERIGTRLVLGCCVGNSQSSSPMASLAQSKLCRCQGLDNRKQRLVLVNPKALLVIWGQQSGGERSTASLRAMRVFNKERFNGALFGPAAAQTKPTH